MMKSANALVGKVGATVAALPEQMSGAASFIVTGLAILHDDEHKDIRLQYRKRYQSRLHVIATFGCFWCFMVAVAAPRVWKYSAVWICSVGGALTVFPTETEKVSWAILIASIGSTALCMVDFDQEYFLQGITHSSIATTSLNFFAGLGARGAVIYASTLCVMVCLMASSPMLAANVTVACMAEAMLCVLLEVSLLHQLAEIERCIAQMKAVEEKKANFMAIVSHELKSPLHGIIGLSSALITSEGVSGIVEKQLNLIHSCARRLLDMVSNIMDASVLVQDKKTKFSRDLVRMDSVVDEVITLCTHSVDKRGKALVRSGVSLVNDCKPLPTIEADSHRCTQLVYNLVTNALKFTHRGHVRVYGQIDDDAEMVKITVEDTGIGISSENLERIFRPFDQEDESEQRRYDGLGLGLAICKEVVVKHGGALTVESVKDEGSKFHVVLPFKMKNFVSESTAKEPKLPPWVSRKGGDTVEKSPPPPALQTSPGPKVGARPLQKVPSVPAQARAVLAEPAAGVDCGTQTAPPPPPQLPPQQPPTAATSGGGLGTGGQCLGPRLGSGAQLAAASTADLSSSAVDLSPAEAAQESQAHAPLLGQPNFRRQSSGLAAVAAGDAPLRPWASSVQDRAVAAAGASMSSLPPLHMDGHLDGASCFGLHEACPVSPSSSVLGAARVMSCGSLPPASSLPSGEHCRLHQTLPELPAIQGGGGPTAPFGSGFPPAGTSQPGPAAAAAASASAAAAAASCLLRQAQPAGAAAAFQAAAALTPQPQQTVVSCQRTATESSCFSGNLPRQEEAPQLPQARDLADMGVPQPQNQKLSQQFAQPIIWELQKQVAHQALHVRHKERDLAKAHLTIQQLTMLVHSLRSQSRPQQLSSPMSAPGMLGGVYSLHPITT